MNKSSNGIKMTGYVKWMAGVGGVFILILLPHVVGVYFTNMLNFILIYSLVVTGLGLLLGWAGQFCLSQAGFFGIGAYTSALITRHYGISPWLGIVFGTSLVGIIAYIMGKPLLSVPGFKVGFVTLGFGWVIWLLMGRLSLLGGHEGLTGVSHLSLGGFVLDKDFHYYYLLVIVVAMVYFLNRNLVKSKIGKEMHAMDTFTGGSVVASKSLGINTGDLKVKIFTIAAAYAGLAGGIYAHYLTTVCPEPFGIWPNLIILIMVIVGGVHSLWSGILGAGTFFGIKELITFSLGRNTPPGWEYLTFGILVTLILLFFPEGIAGVFFQLRLWWNQRVSSI